MRLVRAVRSFVSLNRASLVVRETLASRVCVLVTVTEVVVMASVPGPVRVTLRNLLVCLSRVLVVRNCISKRLKSPRARGLLSVTLAAVLT